MTWTAQTTVTDVSEDHPDEGQTTVWAEVVQSDTWRPAGLDQDFPALTSNTEGELLIVTLGLTFKGNPGLKIGDRVQATGHFTKTGE